MKQMKKWLKRSGAALLAAAMAVTMLLDVSGNMRTVQAAENTAPTEAYWTDDFSAFGLADGKTIGKIRFGASDRTWAICGQGTYETANNQLALLSTSKFCAVEYNKTTHTSNYSESDFYTDIAKYSDDTTGTGSQYLSGTYFSQAEIDKMATVTVSTNEKESGTYTKKSVSGKMYLPDAVDQYSKEATSIYVGSQNDIEIALPKLKTVSGSVTFWLRSPDGNNTDSSYDYALTANFIEVNCNSVYNYTPVDNVEVMPAFNLDLSDVLFASSAPAAASAGYAAASGLEENTYTLRYTSNDGESAAISADGKTVNYSGLKDGKTYYLMVQNSEGVSAALIGSGSNCVTASTFTDANLTDFYHCKVWLESTDSERITTAVLATQETDEISAVTISIDAPEGGKAFGAAACTTAEVANTSAVSWTKTDGTAAGDTADYNTQYTASVTLTADTRGYTFADTVTATVNGQTAASVTKNDDGTLTVTYTFPATADAPAEDATSSRVVMEEGIKDIPEELKAAGYDTEEKITETLLERVVVESDGYTREQTLTYDVDLQFSTDGGETWVTATPDNFPTNGLTVTVPYPDGTSKDGYEFSVAHMFTHSMNGHTPGEIELPTVTNTDNGLQFTVYGLSPVTIAWKEVTQETATDTTTDDSVNPYEEYVNQIANAADGATVTITGDAGINALPNSIMQALYQKGTVNLTMTYTYEGQTYTITIPAGGAVNDETPWYGPLYLSAHYSGATANTVASSGTVTAATDGSISASATLKSPQTGDDMPLALMLVLLLGSAIGAIVLTRRALRRGIF